MTTRTCARLHAWLLLVVATTARRLRTAPQGGQGTVEYVALILLVAAVLAAAVGLATKSKFNLAAIVTKELQQAVEVVSGRAPK